MKNNAADQSVITSGYCAMGRIKKAIIAIYNSHSELGRVKQKDIAALWGVSQASVSNFFAGAEGKINLTDERIEQFCDQFNVTLSDLDRMTQTRRKPAAVVDLWAHVAEKHRAAHQHLENVLREAQGKWKQGIMAAVEALALHVARSGEGKDFTADTLPVLTAEPARHNPAVRTPKQPKKRKKRGAVAEFP